MKAIYDIRGEVVGWKALKDIFNLSGNCIAFIDEENVFSLNEFHLGSYNRGVFRDLQGRVVAFLHGASNTGVELPSIQIDPIPPIIKIPSMHSIPSIPPLPDPPMPKWGRSWIEFIKEAND